MLARPGAAAFWDQAGIGRTCRSVVPERGYMNHRSKVRRSLLLAVFVLAVATSPVMAGADRPALTVTKGSRISVDVDNQPLNALLRMMAEKRLFNISGGAAGNESLTLHFSNLTLPEALSKMLRGYNYVVIDQGKNQLPVLTVMGKIQKGRRRPMRNARPRAACPARTEKLCAPGASARSRPAPPATRSRPAPGQPRGPGPAPARQETGRTDGASRATGSGRRIDRGGRQRPADGQPGGEAQRQAGQQAPGGQPAPPAEAPPAESPGVHF